MAGLDNRYLKYIIWHAVAGVCHIQEVPDLSAVHPKMPGVSLLLPDHRRRDLDPVTLGRAVQIAGLTAEQFSRLSGSGHRRYPGQMRQGVYGMEG